MDELTIRFVPEGGSEAETGRLSAKLRELIREHVPGATVQTERADPEAMEAGSVIVVCLAHIALTALIEVVKTYWELHPGTFVKIQAKDGTLLSFRGVTPEFEHTIKKIAETVTDKPK